MSDHWRLATRAAAVALLLMTMAACGEYEPTALVRKIPGPVAAVDPATQAYTSLVANDYHAQQEAAQKAVQPCTAQYSSTSCREAMSGYQKTVAKFHDELGPTAVPPRYKILDDYLRRAIDEVLTGLKQSLTVQEGADTTGMLTANDYLMQSKSQLDDAVTRILRCQRKGGDSCGG